MTRVTVEIVYSELSEIVLQQECHGLVDRTRGGGKEQLHLRTKLLVFLWFIANKSCYREIGNLFGICETSCCDIVHKILKTFSLYLVAKVIKWPTHNEMIEISWLIEEMKGFPYVIGMIDGSHIAVRRPRGGGDVFYNRKDFFSIVLQGK